jgi:hypothetical protein
MHVMETFVNFRKLPVVSDIFINLDFSVEVIYSKLVEQISFVPESTSRYLRPVLGSQFCP